MGLLWLGLLASCKTPKPLSTIDLSHSYADSEAFSVKVQSLEAENYLRIYATIQDQSLGMVIKDSAQFWQRFSLTVQWAASFEDEPSLLPDTIKPSQVFFGTTPNQVGVVFDVGKPDRNAIFGLKVVNKQTLQTCWSLTPFYPSLPWIQRSLGFFKPNTAMPLASQFVTLKDTIELESLDQLPKQLYVKEYQLTLPTPAPPMVTDAGRIRLPIPSAKYVIDPKTPLIFSEPGLYWFQVDTTKPEGVALMVTREAFPEINRASQMVDPLIYITTRDERARLLASATPKTQLDQFWLDLGGNHETARGLIKDFYIRVEAANKLFTDYREGWKTDRGMIYTIFGAPDKVRRRGLLEEWWYEANGDFGELQFFFEQKPTIFTPANHELVRHQDYEKVWFGTVDQWRKGITKK